MIGDWTSILQLILVVFLEYAGYFLRILGNNTQIINIDGNVLINVAVAPHPDVVFGFGWGKLHIMKCIRKSLMPT